jgi:Ca2+-binding RTX toxin-like protein
LLVIYGDTSQDGIWYSGDPATVEGKEFGPKPFDKLAKFDEDQVWEFTLANPFRNAGNDVIIAGPGAGMLTVFGGPGDDTIVGSKDGDHLAGGSGDDTIDGQGGIDQIYGDSGFNVDVLGDPEPLRRFDVVIDPSAPISRAEAETLAGPVLTVPTVNASAFPEADPLTVGDDVLRGGDDDDIIFGDHGRITTEVEVLDFAGKLASLPPLKIRTTAYDFINRNGATQSDILTMASEVLDQGGDDTIFGEADEDILVGGANRLLGAVRGGDTIDGGLHEDLILGDNVRLDHRAATVDPRDRNPRIRQLTGGLIYDATGHQLTDPTTPFADPRIDGASWANFEIANLDHTFALEARADGSFGNDYIAGGPDDDLIFGQLGDDIIQGDGSISGKVVDAAPVGAVRLDDGLGTLVVAPSFDAESDGDDYIEGGGGHDVVFGNQGQDDIVGGSSSLFSLDTRAERPDGEDILFGGAGTRTARNILGQGGDSILGQVAQHARDADVIMGDNANVFVLIDAQDAFPGDFLEFNYDQNPDIGNDPADPLALQHRGSLRLIPRAFALLDYTPGVEGPDNIGGSDLIKGEDGDDVIHGMLKNDVLYGDGWDDDVYGGTGRDKIFGGSGEDGLLGDDGLIQTSRNGIAEPLYGIAAQAETVLGIPKPDNAQFIGAVVDITNLLKKTVDLTVGDHADPLFTWKNGDTDIVYGGRGDDFIHGGAADDALSGAEALPEFYQDTRPQPDAPPIVYNPDPDRRTLDFWRDPFTGALEPFYDPDNPRTKIAGFILNFDSFEPNGDLIEDGKDWIFGDLGHDVLFGGTGHDRLFGGLGDDYHQADDNLDTDGGLNNNADDFRLPGTTAGAGDFAFGGGGLDVLIANTGADRLFDWTGEFNSFVVPFARFGAPTVNRQVSPHAKEFLRGLADAGGMDPGLLEPNNELGLVDQDDPEWNDQHGGPRDPQPGNFPPGAYDDPAEPEDDTDVAFKGILQDEHGSTPSGRRATKDIPDVPVGDIRIEKAINAVDPLLPTPAEDADTFDTRAASGCESPRSSTTSGRRPTPATTSTLFW